MLRSLYSGIGGMNNFQTKLDVIGNNIANVNTYGFKKGRTTFNDLVSQQLQGAGTPNDNRGGTNPLQVGLGGGTSTIDTIDTQGSLQSTGRDLDLAISGDGYFVVEDGDTQLFTRAGNFYLDQNGMLVNSNGLKVQGYLNQAAPIDENTALSDLYIPAGASIQQLNAGDNTTNPVRPGLNIDIGGANINETFLQSFNIAPSGEINGVFSDGQVRVLGTLALANFSNPGGLNKAGNNTFSQTNNSGAAQIGLSNTDGRGSLVGATLEMSNVDLAAEFAEMIVSQRGFQANTRIITTSDEILQELVNLKR
ncbi:flagellar hook-basal body complex protein [Paenalkalicoccus suaedae]|uniref:Flagellar hook protein FlgE n=1 Tax=Paenalkalicoccus suaedae TaxID=2592382 RepID=A0A859FFG7_9BACI|nr:flagellar basal body rod protein FlgG [Paenalkalicoccus suaedae]QKS71432.1 flagellar hook-basal body complex protein [Paenalkalicoccus suaedae]